MRSCEDEGPQSLGELQPRRRTHSLYQRPFCEVYVAIRSRFSPPEFPNVWSAVSFCSHASVLHGFSFRCLQCGNRRAGLAGTIQEQIVDEEWRQPQQIEESCCFPAAIARRQHEWSRQFSLAERSPEKAGVGGSTPSLATTFQSSYIESAKSLQSAFSPLLAAVAPPRMA